MLRILQRFEAHIARPGRGFYLLEHLRQREPQPRNDHRPRLYATQPIDPLFKLIGLDEVFQCIAPGLANLTIHHDRPRFGLQAVAIGCRVALVRPELIEVVVVGGILERRDRLILDRYRLPARGRELVAEPARRCPRLDVRVARCLGRPRRQRHRTQSKARQGAPQQRATGKIEAFGGDLRCLAVGRPG
ncbi:hypothetical protein D3C76_1150760 [compost metagenome]